MTTTSVPSTWREIPQRYRYEAAQCKGCSKMFFPPRRVCSGCRGREFEATTLSGSGTIQTYSVVRVAPSGFTDQVPYAIGVIEMDGGVKLTAQVVDCDPETLAVGDKVRMEFRKVRKDGHSGILCYGYKFVPEI